MDDKALTQAGQPGYIGWKTASTSGFTDKLYIAIKGVKGTTEVAYCYNLEKTFPGTRGKILVRLQMQVQLILIA